MKRMKKVVGLFLALALAISAEASVRRSYGKSGTASNVNATVTYTFNPLNFWVCNLSTTVDFYVDYTDGVAVAADNSTNLIVSAGTCISESWQDNSVTQTFTVGIITAASTAAYNMGGSR